MNKLGLLFLLILLACNDSKIITNEEVILVIDDKKFYSNDLDSLIEEEVISIKKKGIQKLITNYLLNKEANKRNVTVDSLLKKETILRSNIKIEFTNDFNKLTDSEKMKYYQNTLLIKQRESAYIDSLCNISNIDVFLKLKENGIFQYQNISSFSFNKRDTKNKIYIISDPFCESCLQITEQVDQFIKEYKHIDFQYVYFSQPISDIGIALFSANQEGKFYAYYKHLINDVKNNKEPNIIEIANKINIDTVTFKKNIAKKIGMKELMINNELLVKNNIYSTPSFIVNNKIYSGSEIIYYLRNMIQNEFE